MVAQNNIIGEVGLRVVPVDPAAQFQAGVDQIIKRLEKNAQFQIQASGLDRVSEQANTAGSAFASAAIQAAGLSAAVFGIERAVKGAINKFAGLFDQLAQAKAGFSSILKSDALGGALLDDIREFARVSPFVTQELVNYSQQLLGVGLNAQKIIPLLKSTGDIISSVGGDTQNLGRVLFTLTQIKSIGSLKGQDTLQLQNSLIPITKYLSEFLHKSTAEIVKLRENGQITAENVFDSLNAQGEKVKGAMDKATRNIAGARAILSDTITIMLQNQPVLNKIFKDIFQSILTFSNFIGTSEFQASFTRFFDGVNRVYEGIKPLFAELGKIASSGAITGLQIFGTALSTIGDVLNAIPKVAIQAFAQLLAALAVIRAPLLLFQYAQSIQRIGSAIVPAATGLLRLRGATTLAADAASYATSVYRNEVSALDANTAALTANQRAVLGNAAAQQGLVGGGTGTAGFFAKHPRVGQGLQAGAAIGGGLLSGRDDTASQVAGSALTYGAIGASFGPEGAIIGAAYGGLTAYFNSVKEKARKFQEELVTLGKDGASNFILETDKAFGSGVSGNSFGAYKTELTKLDSGITKLKNKAAALSLPVAGDQTKDAYLAAETANNDSLATTTNALSLLQTKQADIKKQEVTLFEPARLGLKALIPLLDKNQAAFKALTEVGRGGVRFATEDIAKAEAVAKKYGFTLDDLANPEKAEGIARITKSWDGLTSAEQQAIDRANVYNGIFDEAKKNAEAEFGGQKKALENSLSYQKAIDIAKKAQTDVSTKGARQNADLEIFNAKIAASAQAETEAKLKGYSIAVQLGLKLEAQLAIEKELLGIRRDSSNAYGARSKFNQANLDDTSNNDPLSVNLYANQEADRVAQAKLDEEARKKAEEAAKKAADEAAAYADKVRTATASLSDKLQSAADAIASAAERWVGSIKERTQYEQAVSAGTAIKNTERQIKDLAELTAGLNELRARGLTDDAIKALGIDNVNDVKQVRKLLKANPGDLSKLSGDVATLNSKATDAATASEDKRTQSNIKDGILAAANTLGLDLTKPDAAALANQFHITTTSNADEIANAILFALSGGKIGR